MWQHASTERYNITNVYGMNTWNKENQKLKYVVSRQHIKKTSGQVHFFFFALEFFDIYGQKLAISDVGENSNFEACLLMR